MEKLILIVVAYITIFAMEILAYYVSQSAFIFVYGIITLLGFIFTFGISLIFNTRK